MNAIELIMKECRIKEMRVINKDGSEVTEYVDDARDRQDR